MYTCITSCVENVPVGTHACLYICLFDCLYARVSRDHTSKFHQIFRTCYCGHGSLLLWRQCDTLCTSGFVDDVTFYYNAGNRPESNTSRMFHPVRQVAAPGAKSTVADCILCVLWTFFLIMTNI